MKKSELVRVGYIDKNGYFVSVYTISRVIRNNTIRYNKKTYVMFDENWNCFVTQEALDAYEKPVEKSKVGTQRSPFGIGS